MSDNTIVIYEPKTIIVSGVGVGLSGWGTLIGNINDQEDLKISLDSIKLTVTNEVSRATTAENAIQADVDANQTASELADTTLTTD